MGQIQGLGGPRPVGHQARRLPRIMPPAEPAEAEVAGPDARILPFPSAGRCLPAARSSQGSRWPRVALMASRRDHVSVVASLIVLTGPPGAGKTTVARLVADAFDPSVHLPADDFWRYIRSGYAAPWQPQSQAQNTVVIDALA